MGASLIISPFLLHRHRRYWPEEAVSGRPLPSLFDKRVGGLDAHSYEAFVPFSDGSKRCPAGRLALLEMRGVLAMVLHEFELVETEVASHRMKGSTHGLKL